VKDVDDKLFSIEETICDEFAGAKCGTFVRLKVGVRNKKKSVR
jgi:hypothetical protein